MSHATTGRVGRVHHARRKKTKDIVQADRQLHQQDAETERRGRSTAGQAQGSPCGDAAAGFLRSVFLPKLCVANRVNTDDKTAKATARDAYTSLASLAAHYGIEPMDTKGFTYPYNIALTIPDTGKLLKEKMNDFYKLRLVRQGKKTFFLTEERYRTGSTLFYIPVAPLYNMLCNPKRRKAACLLLSVCCYLYHIADIPYHRQQSSFMYWQYEMIEEMILQDGEDVEYAEDLKKELREMACIGDIIEKKIGNRSNLSVFGKQLENFCCRSAFDNDCYHLANGIFELYQQYPEESIFRYSGRIDAADQKDEYGDNSMLTMDRYISFIHSTDDSLYYSYLSDMINNEFNEYGEIEEPILRRCFYGDKTVSENFNFEHRLFALMDELATLLYKY